MKLKEDYQHAKFYHILIYMITFFISFYPSRFSDSNPVLKFMPYLAIQNQWTNMITENAQLFMQVNNETDAKQSL